MKDSSLPIRTAFVSAIEALGFTVFDSVPNEAGTPYVHVYNQSAKPIGTQDTEGQTAMITLDIVTDYQKDTGGSKQADEIANAILGLITYPPHKIAVDGFDLVAIDLDATNSAQYTTDTHSQFIRTIRIKLTLYQN